MNTLKIGVILLAFLLAAMVTVPMVNATGSPDSAAQVNASQVQLPTLHFDNSQQKVVVNNELSVRPSSAISQSNQLASISYQNQGVTSIPYGAIIYHENNVTTVFDASGNQLFSADDNHASFVYTYKGEQPATFVHEVPSNSTIVNMGDTLHVIYKGTRILTIIRNTSGSSQSYSAQSSTSATPKSCSPNLPPGYIEGTDTNPTMISSPKTFSAYWYVPSSPTGNPGTYGSPGSVGNAKPITIWNGFYGCIQGDPDSLLVQPVLEWYVCDKLDSSCPTTPQWTEAAWYVWGMNNTITVNGVKNIDFIHSTRMGGINPGDEMGGNIQISTAGYDAIGSIADLTGSAGSTTLWLTQYTEEGGVLIPVRMSTQDLYATIMLEGWNPLQYPGNATNLPGPVTFSNFILTDQNGDNLLSSTPMNTYINNQSWNQNTFPDYQNLSVYNQWPSTIVLLNNPSRINPPVVSFTGSPRTGSGSDYVIFQDQSTGSPFLWNWSFGDGAYSSNQNPAHYYTAPGSYTVNLTVVGAGGVRFDNQPNYIVVS